MTILHPLMPADEIFDGEIKNAMLPDGTKVAIYNLNGTYYVTDDTCTHEAASLSEEGMIDGSNVVCGWHFCGFDIASGQATASPCNEALRTYAVQVVGGVVHAVV